MSEGTKNKEKQHRDVITGPPDEALAPFNDQEESTMEMDVVMTVDELSNLGVCTGEINSKGNIVQVLKLGNRRLRKDDHCIIRQKSRGH